MSSTRRPEKQGRPAALLGREVDRFGAEPAWIARYRITLIQAARRWVSVSRSGAGLGFRAVAACLHEQGAPAIMKIDDVQVQLVGARGGC